MKNFLTKFLITILAIFSLSATPALAASNYYINTRGNAIYTPIRKATIPQGSTAKCRDSSYSFSQSRRGTCSHHGGVSRWY